MLVVCRAHTILYLPMYVCRVEWMYQYQGMVILAANQVWWTWEVEDVFRRVRRGDKMALKNYAKKLHSQIDALVVQVGGEGWSVVMECVCVCSRMCDCWVSGWVELATYVLCECLASISACLVSALGPFSAVQE